MSLQDVDRKASQYVLTILKLTIERFEVGEQISLCSDMWGRPRS